MIGMMLRKRCYSYTWVRSRLEWEEYTAAANAAGIGRHDGDEDGDDGDVISDDNDDDVVMVMILIAMMMIMGFKNLKKKWLYLQVY